MSISTTVERYRSAVLTTANQLTLLRIIFVPVFIILLVYSDTGWALLVFLAAGITDALDGFIARRYGQKTAVGAFLDPIADKLLMTSAVVLLSLPFMEFVNVLPRWLMVIMISRDVFIFLFTLVLVVMTGMRKFPPSPYGKISTALQVGTVLAVLFCNWQQAAIPQLQILYFMTGFMTAFSGVHYLVTKVLVVR
jgi:cardiolipin synthase (CMP-forming)